MRLLKVGLAGTVVVLLLALVPGAGASPTHGVVTTCSTNWSCDFVFNGTAGPGWANASSSGFLYRGTMTLRLPGESTTSTNLSYWTHTQTITTNYTAGNTTYWTVGTFTGPDWNTGKVVYGTTNTNFTATCHHVFRWCHYTYTTDNGVIVVKSTRAAPTATNITCSPTTIAVSSRTSCTATVHNLWNATNYPVGKLHFLSSGGGTFSNSGTCTLSSKGTCTFTWSPADDTCSWSSLSVTYGGTTYYYRSSGSILITVTGGC